MRTVLSLIVLPIALVLFASCERNLDSSIETQDQGTGGDGADDRDGQVARDEGTDGPHDDGPDDDGPDDDGPDDDGPDDDGPGDDGPGDDGPGDLDGDVPNDEGPDEGSDV